MYWELPRAKVNSKNNPILVELGYWVALLAPWLLIVGLLFPRLSFGAQDLRVLETMPLGRDEAYVAGVLWDGWSKGLPVFSIVYGHWYLNLGWAILLVISQFTAVTEQTVIVTLRAISLFSYLSVGIMIGFWLRRLIGRTGAVLYSAIFVWLSSGGDLITRATACQPDLLNLAGSVLTVFACLELANKFRFYWLCLASIGAGLVMAVKYSGFLFLPYIGLVLLAYALFAPISQISPNPGKVSNEYMSRVMFFISSIIIELLLFLLSFGLASPLSWWNLTFIQNLLGHATVLTQSNSGVFAWVQFLFTEALGPILFALLIAGMIIALASFTGKKDGKFRAQLSSVFWLLLIFIFIFLFVKRIQYRFLFPFFPVFVYLIVLPIQYLVNHVGAQTGKKTVPIALTSLILTVGTGWIVFREQQTNLTQYSCLECLPGIQVGAWLRNNVRPENRILQDWTAYIPKEYQTIYLLNYGDFYLQLEKFQPDIVILNTPYIRSLFALQDNEIEDIYFQKAGVTKQFYGDLLNHRLPFRELAVIGNREQGSGFVILGRDHP